MMKPRLDFEGVFHLLPSHRAVKSGYRPQHLLHENYQSTGIHSYPERELIEPGVAGRVQVTLITPEVYPCCIWVGRVLSIFEGSRLVGTIRVDRIQNESLRVLPELYKLVWQEPVQFEIAP